MERLLESIRTAEPLLRTYEPSDTEPSEQKAVNVGVGLTNLRTHEPSEQRTFYFGLTNLRTTEPSNYIEQSPR